VGGLLLAYALRLKPSSYRLIKTKDGSVAICLDNKRVVAGYGGPLVVSDENCPNLPGTGRQNRVVMRSRKLLFLGSLESTNEKAEALGSGPFIYSRQPTPCQCD
jgi:hypothetical protein